MTNLGDGFQAPSCLAPFHGPLIVERIANQGDQDRGESGQTCPLHLLPNGGGVNFTEPVRRHPETDSVFDAARAGETAQLAGENNGRFRNREENWFRAPLLRHILKTG